MKAKKAREAASEVSTRGRRIGLLYGLTGLFGVVIVGLLLARPRPLRAQEDSPQVALLASRTDGGIDPLDIALQTGDAATPGKFTGVSVLRLTTSQARARHAHFKVVLDESNVAPQVVVGQEWLTQSFVPMDASGNFVLVVVVDDHEREIRHEATVVALVERLCSRLKVDAGQVKWS
jgi:hypothetical protein